MSPGAPILRGPEDPNLARATLYALGTIGVAAVIVGALWLFGVLPMR